MIEWRPAVGGEPAAGLPPLTERRTHHVNLAREVPLLALLAVVIAWALKGLVAQAFYIPSESMLPQLEVGDRVVVSKLAYRLHDPRRGDVVVFDAPPGVDSPDPPDRSVLPVRILRSLAEAIGVRQPSTSEFIKRIVALPGETVEGKGGKVFVNGLELLEPYLPPGMVTSDFGPLTVPEGTLWVMGDNRNHSMDSRSPNVGPIARDSVVGRAFVRAWPFGRAAFL